MKHPDTASASTKTEFQGGVTLVTVSVLDAGAVGDGVQLDTDAINRAITKCSLAGGGVVVFPAGRYLSGTIRLQSRVSLRLELGSEIRGAADLAQYDIPEPHASASEDKWSNWHRALILGQSVEDVTISGEGVINGNKVVDPAGEEQMRGPHTILFIDSRRFTIRDLSICNAANYGILFYTSDDIDIQNVKITGGWDGIHFRGTPEQFCRNVNIFGCRFYTGDDSIAGSYWDRTTVCGCIFNSSCNGIRLIGPAKHLIIHDCLFYGPGEQPHRTSGRTNMLSGILLQPGAWESTQGPLDDILLAGNTMRNVATPVTIWTTPGATGGRITISNLQATGVYEAAMSAESWANEPIDQVILRNVNVAFTGGPSTEVKQEVTAPHVSARPLPAWGFYGRNIRKLVFEDVRLNLETVNDRAVLLADNVNQLSLDGLKFSKIHGVEQAIQLVNGSKLMSSQFERAGDH